MKTMKQLLLTLAVLLFSVVANAQDNKHEYVDLGLPSGTLWATFNIGATQPHESGYYLAWGELEEKSVYNLSTYFDSSYSLYNRSNRSLRATEHDAATVLWGRQWCMPTYEQAVELYHECQWHWTDNYNDTGVSGMICVGPNENSIFFPAAGLMMDSSKSYTGYGNYWTAELDANVWEEYVCFIDFHSGGLIHSNFCLTSADYRYWGRNIRPVVNPDHKEEIETKKCATPIIAYENGQLTISCDTEGAEFVTEIENSDIKTHYDSTIDLAVTYNIATYATLNGYDNSDVATATLCWIEKETVSTDITQIESTPVLITTNNGDIILCGAEEGTEIVVYDVNGIEAGAEIANGDEVVISTSLGKGAVAIVNIGKKTVKVIMR